jgi:hypothetical protein
VPKTRVFYLCLQGSSGSNIGLVDAIGQKFSAKEAQGEEVEMHKPETFVNTGRSRYRRGIPGRSAISSCEPCALRKASQWDSDLELGTRPELNSVRCQLKSLRSRRLKEPLDPRRELLYELLCLREKELADVTATQEHDQVDRMASTWTVSAAHRVEFQ